MGEKRLAEVILLTPPTQAPRRFRWFDQLSAGDQDELLEVKALWKSGTLRTTATACAKRIMAARKAQGKPLAASLSAIGDWIRHD